MKLEIEVTARAWASDLESGALDLIELLIDLHRQTSRQGPGSNETTRRAMELASLEPSVGLRVADLGCGTGASALQLAAELDARVTAVDFSDDFS